MKLGKHICETLKGIRADIARANEIEYHPTECTHQGDCAGTCPACESEMRWLEHQLRLRQRLGKAVTIAGLSIGAGTLLTSCNLFGTRTAGKIAVLEGEVANWQYVDSTQRVAGTEYGDSAEIEPLAGDVEMMPDSVETCDVDSGNASQLSKQPETKNPPRRTVGAVPKPKPKPGKGGGK